MKRVVFTAGALLVTAVLFMWAQQVSPLFYVVNAQTGTTYTIAATDANKLVTFNNAGAIAVTLNQSTASYFPPGTCFEGQDYGAGTATITPGTSTINNGAGSFTLTTGQGAKICADGSNNYQVQTGRGSGGTVTSAVIAGTANQITASGTCTITTTGTCTLSVPAAFTAPGSVTLTTFLQLAVNSVTSSASPNFDLSLANIQTIAALANNATATFSNISAGRKYTFFLCQDATGGRTFTWPATAKGAMTIGSTASLCSSQDFYSNGTNLYAIAPGLVNE
jgi:hypothetical protein